MTDSTTTPLVTGLNADMTVNEITNRFPATLPVLNALGLDTCCGGGHPLRFVAEHHGLELEDVLSRLREATGTNR